MGVVAGLSVVWVVGSAGVFGVSWCWWGRCRGAVGYVVVVRGDVGCVAVGVVVVVEGVLWLSCVVVVSVIPVSCSVWG